MQRYIALLRAINVGGHTVTMDRLRRILEEHGLGDVHTVLASGNVAFQSPVTDAAALETGIERHLQQTLGYEVATFVRTRSELAEVAKRAPWGELASEDPRYTRMVIFVRTEPDAETRQRIEDLRSDTDDFAVTGREVFWLCRGRISDSLAAAPLAKALGPASTMRNFNTVRKLAASFPPE